MSLVLNDRNDYLTMFLYLIQMASGNAHHNSYYCLINGGDTPPKSCQRISFTDNAS